MATNIATCHFQYTNLCVLEMTSICLVICLVFILYNILFYILLIYNKHVVTLTLIYLL